LFYVENETGGYTNAHAQNVSVGTYAYNVCCNADSDGETVGNSCDDSDAVNILNLSSTDNAHVEIPSEGNYPVGICISVTNRILSCGNYTGSCPASYACVASIVSSEAGDNNVTNAHVDASCTDYNTLICCGYSNSPPVMISARINPNTTVYTNNSLNGYCHASDADGENLDYHYIWFRNDSSQSTGTNTNNPEDTEVNIDTILSSETLKTETWIISCKADDGRFNSSWMNSSTVTILNHAPDKIILDYPLNGDANFINRSPRFNWTVGTDIDNDALTYNLEVATDINFATVIINQTGIGNNYYTYTDELDFDEYFWRVKANDGTVFGPFSNISNFTVVKYISVILTNNNMNFGSEIERNTINDTTDNDPEPFHFLSYSNYYVNLYNTTTNTTLWDSVSLDTQYWTMKARSKGNDGTFNETGSNTTWIDISNYMPNLINYFNYTSPKNNVSMDIGIEVPYYETPGSKEGSIIFVWEVVN